MNVLKYELRRLLKSFVLWSLSVASLQLIFMAFFPIISDDAVMMDRIMENYPEVLLKAFGMSGQLSLSTIMGYMGFVFVFVQLCLAVQSAYYGFDFLSTEERERTADFLFTKPISRLNIFLSKYFSHFLVLMGTALVVAISVKLSFEWFGNDKQYDQKSYYALMASIPFFQLCFFHLGMLFTVLLKKIKSVIGFAIAAAFGLYMLNAVRAVIGGKVLGWVSPYYYFEVTRIVELGSFDGERVWLGIVFIVVSFAVALPLYLKRNIHAI